MARRKRKQHVNAKKCSYDNIEFKSKLEMACYKAFKREGIPVSYESETIQLLQPFVDPAPLYKSHGKSPVSEKTNKVQGISYTPDFVDELNNPHRGFYVEVKGRANESYPMRLKMFRWWRMRNGITKEFYQVGNEAEIEQMIQLIKSNL